MKSKYIGIDIGATTIKTVWLAHQNGTFILNSASIVPSPPKGMFSESPVDQEAMAQAIRSIMSESKITARLVNLSLPENQVYTRVLEMPVLSDKELSSAIYWEAEQYIPVPLNNITLDWKVLKRPKPNEIETKMQVLLVGAPTSLINKYQKVLEMSGLTINAIETEILAAVRALIGSISIGEEKKPDYAQNVMILNIGAASSALAIVREGLVVFTYPIPTGGSAINRAIASDFGFSMSQAEEYKKTYGYSSKDLEGKIGKASKPVLMSILSEIKKAIAFYNEKYKGDMPIKQILLSGGTAKLPGLSVFFADNCGIETVIANPWKILVNQELPKEITENAPDYTVSVGLAMRDYE